MTKQINVGGVAIGGGAPVTVQSMTNTVDYESTLSQIKALRAAGCDIVRVSIPHRQAARDLARLKGQVDIPIVADIHFDYRLALEALEAGADKIRINPGNIGAPERVRAVARACMARGVPIRIGVNGGSLEKELLAKYGGATAEALAESALNQIRLLNSFGFDDICVSLKSSDVHTTVAANRLMARRTNYPLHIGVTEAGTEHMGILRSAVGLGALLLDGIGDTIRVSLTADPVREVTAGIELLRTLGLRQGARLISCPTCARAQSDVISLAQEVERRLAGVDKPVTVAVMGCAVNGPGEAAAADFGAACGKNTGVIFAGGKILKTVPYDAIADELLALVLADKMT